MISTPFGPNHFCSSFGSAHAFQTTWRGASNTREITNSSGLLISLLAFSAGIFLLLFLQFAQVLVKAIEAVFPEPAVVIEPVGDFFQACGLDAAGAPLRIAAAGDEPRVLENFQMLRDRRQAHLERLGQLRHRGVPARETRENRPAGRIGQSREGET